MRCQDHLYKALFLALVLNVGCSSTAPAQRAQDNARSRPDEPRIITNLSQVSTADTSVQLEQPAFRMPPASSARTSVSADTEVQRNIDRFFVSTAPKLRYTEEPTPPPGDVRLLNAKANQFANFCYQMLRQTLAVAQKLGPEKLQQRKIPYELKAVVLTAVMDPVGRLRELVVEQHSGEVRVDQVIIEACKQGLWSRNPPVGAIAKDGNYRLLIQGIINNYSVNREGKYTYSTRLGLSLL
jgi:hypothetical protein